MDSALSEDVHWEQIRLAMDSQHNCVPAMAVTPQWLRSHRPKAAAPLYNACVAKPVSRKEAMSIPLAKDALQAEWDRLRAVPQPGTDRKGCWDEDKVREWRDVKAEAQRRGVKAHVGRIFDICVQKNSELPDDDKRKKYKGRAVFGGDNVRDEVGNWAMFQDLGSCPATMEAARTADAYGCFPGHASQQADAEPAYTQARLCGTETWVRLPQEQ